MIKRPTPPELCGKIRHATEALKAGRRGFGTMRHWAGDREALGLCSTEELWELLPELLDEINQARPEKCYTGTRPPQRSYQDEPAIKNEELWSFTWNSSRLGKWMYLKFVLAKNGRGEWCYFHIDCHPNAPK